MNIFWFRRDLRLEDNHALYESLKSGETLLVFIFDTSILSELPKNDPRVAFIYDTLKAINERLKTHGTSLRIYHGEVLEVWKSIIKTLNPNTVYINKDYEPYAIQRDQEVNDLFSEHNINLKGYKDQVIFEENEILKPDGKPYTIYTPYMKKWMAALSTVHSFQSEDLLSNCMKIESDFPSLKDIGFESTDIKVKPYGFKNLENYETDRNFPFLDKTSHTSVHLRFGTISVRQAYSMAKTVNETLVKELVWREFFMQILFHFPRVVNENFKTKYNNIAWRNNEEEFGLWCQGKTGYPIVDAGMRELNETGYMHNRVRMIVASFLCKHLLIDWQWGEAYFAQKLLDYDLSANNGNWQWSAGTGCDSAPYFRVFNPSEQVKKFDGQMKYIKKWVKDINSLEYPMPMVEHKFARQRALDTYKIGLN